jgi:hypothetical protein
VVTKQPIKQTLLSKQRLAERTLSRIDENKLSFLWGQELVIVYVNKDYNVWYALTEMTSEDMLDIDKWLGKHLRTLDEDTE